MKELNEEINILSLFNGMGCAFIAADEIGLKDGKRYSSEIEKYPNQMNNALFPNTIQLGDVRNVKGNDLGFIHILMGGSPCQSFSFAGKRKGMSAKEKVIFVEPTEEEYNKYLQNEFMPYCDYEDYIKQNREEFKIIQSKEELELIEILTLDHYLELKDQDFEFEGQSYLFWEYIRILKEVREINPDVYFLLENVVMGKKWEKVLSDAIGINPIKINSALVSAQNRKRLYWSNINVVPDGFFDVKFYIPQPKDEGVFLKDILETFETSNFESQEEFDSYMEKYFLSDKAINTLSNRPKGYNFNIASDSDKSGCLRKDISKNGTTDTYIKIDKKGNVKSNQDKASCFTAGGNSGGNHSDMDLIVQKPRGNNKGGLFIEKSPTLTSNSFEHNNYVKCVAMRGRNPENPKSRVAGLETEQQLEPRNDGKTNCLTSVQKDNLIMQINPSTESGGKQPYQQNRVYDIDGISPSLCAHKSDLIISGTLRTHKDGNGFREVKSGKGATIPARAREDGSGQNVVKINKIIRRLTPRECGRLQTVPKDKLETILSCGVSDTQLYKAFGNGWTIKVITYMMSFLPKEFFKNE